MGSARRFRAVCAGALFLLSNGAPRKAVPGATPVRGVSSPAVEHGATLARQR